ncbi:MAG: hypothetical protein AAF487_12645 [Bacteroidota bacterium]
MKPILKNILAVIAGVIAGSLVNIGIIMIGVALVPVEGCGGISMFTPEYMECLASAMPNFKFVNFIAPLLAHALGTLVGAFVTAKIASSYSKWLALLIGVWFLIGGVSAIMDLGGPAWFKVVDLGLAYIPMALLGWKLSGKKA